MSMFELFAGQNVDGESAIYKVKERGSVIAEELLRFHCSGPWNGSAVQIQVSLDGTASPSIWKTRMMASSTVEAFSFKLPSGVYVRAVLTDAGSPEPSVTVQCVGDLVAV